MILGWVSVNDRLPTRNGSYICCVKVGMPGHVFYEVTILNFATKLNQTNTNFSQFNNRESYKDVYDRPGFYFTCENKWKAEEIEIDDGHAFEPELVVTHWMPIPSSPFEKTL